LYSVLIELKLLIDKEVEGMKYDGSVITDSIGMDLALSIITLYIIVRFVTTTMFAFGWCIPCIRW
jgi:hypothetical protein